MVLGIHRTERRGFTLIELLVVLAIIVLLLGVTVPTFARFGAFSRDDLGRSARDLCTMLRAAKIYAATFRVETAVAYTIAQRQYSAGETPVTVPVIDGVAMVRRVTGSEHPNVTAMLQAVGDPEAKHIFVPVSNDSGQFRPLAEGVVINPSALVLPNGNWLPADQSPGINYVYLQDSDPATAPNPIQPRPYQSPPNNPIAYNNHQITYDGKTFSAFPAHIFHPGGYVDSDSVQPARVQFDVAFSPDLSPTQRYANETRTKIKRVPIEIFQATGRARIKSIPTDATQ